MSNQTGRGPVRLRDALYELSLASDRPDAKLLDEFVRRYPEYAVALTDFAIELATEAGRVRKDEVPIASATEVSPVVSRALSKYQNALHARANERAKSEALDAANSVACESPFVSLDRQSFRALAIQLNVTLVFLCKLRDCLIVPATMTKGFRRYLADKMRITLEQLSGFLDAAQPRLEGQFYKAEQKPAATSQQSFEEAVRSSDLSPEQQDFLLGL